METILIIVLLLVLVGAFPAWPHSREWGYTPVGTILGILLILVVLRYLGVL